MNILIVEDSLSLRRSLRLGLTNLGFTLDDTGDGSEGLSMALTGDYQLLILDIMLPGLDGLSILKALRKAKSNIKVLLLSAKDLPQDKVKGLLEGADDYMTKPFSFDELHARLVNLMRRGDLCVALNKICISNFSLDINLKQLFFGNDKVGLTPNEYKIIECLFSNQNKVISPEKLSEYIVGQYDVISKNSIEAHLSSARKKIKGLGGDLPVKTKRGFGYIAAN
ncbi:response regulator transcription factor [Thalassomonas sp. RHCl1]|uniref:response regulator transcription factor n=1 Tax=Thalassomonas sp. RHCl1 TaxID=2995320 RepID=UPI00248C35D4|nr:response regulator transcription factor [Thalassomonas sp. RHCl1]